MTLVGLHTECIISVATLKETKTQYEMMRKTKKPKKY